MLLGVVVQSIQLPGEVVLVDAERGLEERRELGLKPAVTVVVGVRDQPYQIEHERRGQRGVRPSQVNCIFISVSRKPSK